MQNKSKQIISALLIFVGMLILSNYRILFDMSPFVLPFVFALIKSNYNPYILIVEFFVSNMIVNNSINALLISVSQIAFILLFYLLKVLIKDRRLKIFSNIILLFSNAIFVYFNFVSIKLIALCVLSILMSQLMLYIYSFIFERLIKKGYYAKFYFEEKVALAITFLTLFMGVASLPYNIVKYLGIIILLICSDVFKEKMVFLVAVLMGVSSGLISGTISNMALLPMLALMCIACDNRYIKTIVVFLGDLLLNLTLNIQIFYEFQSIILTATACLVYIVIPKGVIASLQNNFGAKLSLSLTDYLEEIERNEISKKVSYIAEAYKEINNQYKKLIIGDLDESKAVDFISGNVYSSVCENCLKKEECYRDLYVKSGIENYIKIGLKKDKLTLIDVPLQISTCVRLSQLTEKMNDEVKDIKKYVRKVKLQDSRNNLISNQFLGTGEILNSISQNSFDAKVVRTHEKKLIERMNIKNITVKEAVEIFDNNNFKELKLFVKNEDVTKRDLLIEAYKIFKIKFNISSQELSKAAGWSIVTLSPEPKLRHMVGVAMSPRGGEKCGDNYTITKINKNRYIFAIADGMGVGHKANYISDSTLSLVENFYRAGLQSSMISKCVNNIILPLTEENFSALDLLQFNSLTGEVDFIKMGASVSLLKKQSSCEIIYGQSLPVGAVYNAKQTLVSRVVEKDDIVILASDGVVDSFNSIEDFAKYVNSENIVNMQLFAESILEEAAARGKVDDDRTVLAIRFV